MVRDRLAAMKAEHSDAPIEFDLIEINMDTGVFMGDFFNKVFSSFLTFIN